MKILIADKLSPTALAELEALGASLRNEPDLKAEELPAAIGDSEVLIVRSTKVSAEAIAAGAQLGLIVRAGAGVNTIDVAEASARGIHVANCPGKNKDAVAELTIGLLVAADRRIVDACTDLRAGAWKKKVYSKAPGLRGRTLGILGMGAIGQSVADIARSMGMEVIAWSRSLTPVKAQQFGVGFCDSPEAVASAADALTVHLAATPDTKGMLNQALLGHMKDGAILINTSRGNLHDTEALKWAIREKGLRVALDVYEPEPAATDPDFADTELASMITGTPHIGASTDQASEAIALEAAAVVRAYRDTGKPLHPVNARAKSGSGLSLAVRHYNKVGVLAGVLDRLRDSGVNIEEMENSIFAGGKAALCTLTLDHRPSEEVLKSIAAADHVISASLNEA
ncbi:MAG: hypothetical protein D6722_22805 [Bacteroidetes bacterium]|nr:MAG: hypothetical protein D6722_22805 [Bacteroidota bacterium]